MEWKEVRLGDVCELRPGYAFKSKDFGDYPDKVIKIGDINPPIVNYESETGIDLSLYDINKISKYKVTYDDFVLAMTGATIGKVGRYISNNESYLNQRVLLFKPFQNFNSKYVYYTVCSSSFSKYVNNHIDSESAQPNISANTISKYQFFIPLNKEDQRRIANILSSLDRKIELNNKINAQLEEMAQTLFKHWFVDFGPFKDGKFVESELGMIPEGWRVGTLNDICEYSKERIPIESLDNSSYYSTENMLPNKQGATTAASLPSIEATTRCMINDVLVSNIRPYFKKIIRVDKTCGCSTDVLCFHSKRSIYDTFMYLSIFDDKFFDYVMAGSKGTKMPRGDKKQIMQYPIVLPVENNLEQFSLLLEPILSHLSLIKVENRKLASLRDTLLPKLMSGEINLEDYGGE